MNIAVIDDERPSRSELCHLVQGCLPEARILEADSGQAAMELADREPVDVFFLDIHLGDMTGTALAAVLRRIQPEAKLVFATAYDTYAVKAFELEAVDYLVKPFDPKRVKQCIEKLGLCAKKVQPVEDKGSLPGKLTVTSNKRLVVVPVEELAYIETDSHNCILHTVKGDLVSALAMNHYEKKLSAYRFFRIHKSYLVNLDYIIELVPWVNGMMSVKLRGYEKVNLPIGRRQLKALRELFES